jgi:hypothetical protein
MCADVRIMDSSLFGYPFWITIALFVCESSILADPSFFNVLSVYSHSEMYPYVLILYALLDGTRSNFDALLSWIHKHIIERGCET